MADFFAAASDLDRILDEFEENEKPEPNVSKSKVIEKTNTSTPTINRNLKINSKNENILKDTPKESELLIDFSTPDHNLVSNSQKTSPTKGFSANTDLDFLLSISDNEMGALTANITSSTTIKDHNLNTGAITNSIASKNTENHNIENNEYLVASLDNNVDSTSDDNYSPNNDKISDVELTSKSNTHIDGIISEPSKQTDTHRIDIGANNGGNNKILVSDEQFNEEVNTNLTDGFCQEKVPGFNEDIDVDEEEFEQFMAETSAYSEQILNNMTSPLPLKVPQTDNFVSQKEDPQSQKKEFNMTSQISDSHLINQKNEPIKLKTATEHDSEGVLPCEIPKLTSENISNISSDQIISKPRNNSITSQIVESLRKNEILTHSNENFTQLNSQTVISDNLETNQIIKNDTNSGGASTAQIQNGGKNSTDPEPNKELINITALPMNKVVQPSSVQPQRDDEDVASSQANRPQLEGSENLEQRQSIEAENNSSSNLPCQQSQPEDRENDETNSSQQEQQEISSFGGFGRQGQGQEDTYPMVSPPSYSAVLAEEYSAGTRIDEEYSADDNQQMLPEETEVPIINEPGPSEQITADLATPSTSVPPGSLITRPGHTKPHWIPDDQSSNCTQCESKFSFTKRRHHCRACGKIFCNACCNMRSRLEYLDFNEARVCITCYDSILQADAFQAEANLRQQLLLNPNTSSSSHSGPRPVLKNSDDSSGSSTPKSVRFADGTKPDHPATLPDTPPPPSRLSRGVKSRHRNGGSSIYPPTIAGYDEDGGYIVDEHSQLPELERMLKTQDGVVFLLSPNLFVLLRIINYAGSKCSYFTSIGLDLVGQSEVGLIISSQSPIPLQAFTLYAHLFNQARKGKAVHSMDFLLISDFIDSPNPVLFGSNDYSGVLFLRRTLQEDSNLKSNELCDRLHLASNTTTFPSMLFGLLVHKTETPWAKLFPPRLLLGLGAKYKQYPYPLVNHENRSGVYQDVSNTILAILCDCRNYKYKVVVVPGLSVVVSDSNVVISIPCNRFSDMVKIMNSSNEHVLAFGADNISSELQTCHLTAIQDHSAHTYHTEVISADQPINDKGEAGAAFVVFNGSLKTGCTHQAKCTVVEDGVMIQLLPERMSTLKESLRSMDDHRIRCQPPTSSEEGENDVGRSVEIRWVSDDTKFNIGLLSPIDFRSFEGVIGYNVQGKSEKKSKQHLLRWNQVFFFKSTNDVMDMSRLAEQVANGCFQALVPHAKILREAGQIKVGVRVNIHPDDVGYSVGSKGLPLSDQCLNSLDDNLIPLIHENSGSLGSDEDPVEFELIFSVLEIRSSWRTN